MSLNLSLVCTVVLKVACNHYGPQSFKCSKYGCVLQLVQYVLFIMYHCILYHNVKDIQQLEKVQRRAARWVLNDYRYTSSVTLMLKQLSWPTLMLRRRISRLSILYKAIQQQLSLTIPSYYLPPMIILFSLAHPQLRTNIAISQGQLKTGIHYQQPSSKPILIINFYLSYKHTLLTSLLIVNLFNCSYILSS